MMKTFKTWKEFSEHMEAYGKKYHGCRSTNLNKEESLIGLHQSSFHFLCREIYFAKSSDPFKIESGYHVYPTHLRHMPPLGFELPMTIRVRQGSKSIALWGTAEAPSNLPDPFVSMAGFMKVPFNQSVKNQGSVKEFSAMLRRIELVLTKMAFHPQRDLFMDIWVRAYDCSVRNMGTSVTREEMKYLWSLVL